MSEIRKDPFSNEVVIYSPGRENRPNFIGVQKSIELSPENCPFCPGNEDMTPPEIHRRGSGSGWAVRVIPNKFPVLSVEDNFREEGTPQLRKFRGAGAHEVIVESPNHEEALREKGGIRFGPVFTVYRDRIRDLKRDIRLKYVQVFKNHGAAAGATISHPHSQLVALPFVPEGVGRKMKVFRDYFEENGRSLADDVISGEIEDGRRIIAQKGSFLALAPWYSRSPFQVSVFPGEGSARFEDIADSDIEVLSELFSEVMGRLARALGSFSYNLTLNNAPFEELPGPVFRWSLDIFPALEGNGGFETATGTYINSVLPEKAATILRKY